MADAAPVVLSFATTFCCCVDDAAENNNKFAKFVVTYVFRLIDVVDFVMDCIFVANLAKRGLGGWAVLMATGMLLALVTLYAVNRDPDRDKKNGFIPTFFLIEFGIFILEDTTTAMLFTRVDDAYDPSSLADVMNVFTTAVSASMILLLLLAAILAIPAGLILVNCAPNPDPEEPLDASDEYTPGALLCALACSLPFVALMLCYLGLFIFVLIVNVYQEKEIAEWAEKATLVFYCMFFGGCALGCPTKMIMMILFRVEPSEVIEEVAETVDNNNDGRVSRHEELE